MKDRAELPGAEEQLEAATKGTVLGLDESLRPSNSSRHARLPVNDLTDQGLWTGGYGPPFVVGICNDMEVRGTPAAVDDGRLYPTRTPWTCWKPSLEMRRAASRCSRKFMRRRPKSTCSTSDADMELKEMGREMNSLLREERTLRLDRLPRGRQLLRGVGRLQGRPGSSGFRKLQDLIRLRKRWAGQIAEQRYGDMAYRIFQTDALAKYRHQFDLAQTVCLPDRRGLRLRDQPVAAKTRRPASSSCARSWARAPWARFAGRPGHGTSTDRRAPHGLAERSGTHARQLRRAEGPDGLQQPAGRRPTASRCATSCSACGHLGRQLAPDAARYYTSNIFADPIVANWPRSPTASRAPNPGWSSRSAPPSPERLNFFGLPAGPG